MDITDHAIREKAPWILFIKGLVDLNTRLLTNIVVPKEILEEEDLELSK